MSRGYMSQGVHVLGGKCLGGKCPGGKCPGGICPWGKCPGGTCPGGLCPRTLMHTPLHEQISAGLGNERNDLKTDVCILATSGMPEEGNKRYVVTLSILT